MLKIFEDNNLVNLKGSINLVKVNSKSINNEVGIMNIRP